MRNSSEKLTQRVDEAFEEEERLYGELDTFLKSFTDRAEAENTALKTLVPRIDEVRKKRSRLLDELMKEIKTLLADG